MRIWSIALIALCLLGGHAAKAFPDYGPKEDLFDFAGFEWMSNGIWLCTDNCDPNNLAYYMVADIAANRIDVYIVSPADFRLRVELEDATENCTMIAGFVTGRVYAIQDQDRSFIYSIGDTASLSTTDFLLLDLAKFTDTPGSDLYFTESDFFLETVLWDGESTLGDVVTTLDRHQLNLVHQLEKGELSVLDTEAWKEIWESFQKNSAQKVAQFRAVDDPETSEFFKVNHKGRTSPANKRSLTQKAILSRAFLGFQDIPEISLTDLKDVCLDPSDIEKWGYQP